MITDLCVTFGCGKVLTAHEKLCGTKCTEHSYDDAVVSRLTDKDYLKMEIVVIKEQLENDVLELQRTKRSGSSIINTQRDHMITRYNRSILSLNKLVKKLSK